MKKAITPYTKELGSYFRKLRKANGYSQKNLSDFLNYSSSKMISKFERGECGLPFNDLRKLSLKLNLDLKTLTSLLLKEQESIFRAGFERSSSEGQEFKK